MAYTNFPNGITSFGIPMVGGVGGIPLTGNWWFVNATTGSDGNASAGSGGATPDAPLQTLSYAYSCAAEGNNDVVVLMSSETTSAPTQGTGQSSTAEKLCQITGQRNAFVNVAFQGMGSANGAGQAGSYCIYLNGGS